MKNFRKELFFFVIIYTFLFSQAIFRHDSWIALVSAFCGITYTILAGKGFPICYPIGVTGSAFYVYLSFLNHFWGNLILYACYYIPMQIIGFFYWNNNLKTGKYEIVKTTLSRKEKLISSFVTIILSIIVIIILSFYGDRNPIIDGITTVFSILGMYLTVRRCIEQWIVWILVNGFSLIMWLDIAIKGGRVYSTVFMWFVYFTLAIYFYIVWAKELKIKNT